MRARAGVSSGQSIAASALISAQSALSSLLLAAAVLLIATVSNLQRTDSGFEPGGLLAVRLNDAEMGETASERWESVQAVIRDVSTIGSSTRVAAASSLPFERGINTPITVSGRPESSGSVEWRAVTPVYFGTLGIDVRQGRNFLASDDIGGAPVVLVNEAFASRFLSGEPAVGQGIEIGSYRGATTDPARPALTAEVVGVVGDIRELARTAPRPTVYVPVPQAQDHLARLRTPAILVRPGVSEDPERVLEALRTTRVLRSPESAVRVSDLLLSAISRERFAASLLTALAAVALILSAVGTYGVLTYLFSQRKREIGVRRAVGATGSDIGFMVVRRGIVPVVLGVALGLGAFTSLSSPLTAFLWGVTATDASALGTVGLIVLFTGGAAILTPTTRALRVDPVEVLCGE